MGNPATRRALSAWTLHHVGGHAPIPLDRFPAAVPGCVHTDLLAAGLIPDPFVDANELAVAWVADADWEYRTAVDLDAVADHDRAELVFHGLDTLATVSLDGDVVAETENMHRTYRVDVSGRTGRAELAVRFRSATREAEARRDREGEWPSASFGRPFNHVRKMACAWGWDWGPSLTTAGIWRPAELVGWDGARLASVRPIPTVDPDDHGTVAVHVGLQRAGSEDVVVRARLIEPDGRRGDHGRDGCSRRGGRRDTDPRRRPRATVVAPWTRWTAAVRARRRGRDRVRRDNA